MTRMIARPYAPGDILALDRQAAQLTDIADDDWTRWQTYRPTGIAWTFTSGSDVVAIAGLRPLRGEAVAEAWALIGKARKTDWGALLRFGRAALEASPARRIQATAFADHKGAERTLAALGFEKEGVMRAYGPNGRDAALYARVKPCR